MATAWIGLFDERGKTGSAGSPQARVTEPSGPVTAMLPRWTDSTKPPRVTWATTGASARADGVGAMRRDAVWSGTWPTLSARGGRTASAVVGGGTPNDRGR